MHPDASEGPGVADPVRLAISLSDRGRRAMTGDDEPMTEQAADQPKD